MRIWIRSSQSTLRHAGYEWSQGAAGVRLKRERSPLLAFAGAPDPYSKFPAASAARRVWHKDWPHLEQTARRQHQYPYPRVQ